MVITTLDHLLSPYQDLLGKDFLAYRNHCQRVLNFCQALDSDSSNWSKYCIAAAFHDLGIWTGQTFDYLNPSLDLAREYPDKADLDEIMLMIEFHHKRSIYKGPFEDTVNVFRKADMIDLSLGLLKYKIPKEKVRSIKNEFSNSGFHFFLLRKGFAYFFRHPLRPLPMFKK